MRSSSRYILFVLCLVPLFSSCSKDRGFRLGRAGSGGDVNRCLEMLEKKKYEPAIKCLEAYKSRTYGSPEAAAADLAVADAYFLKKEYLVAAEAYNLFIETNPNHPQLPYAYYKMGQSYLKDMPKSLDRDQGNLDKSLKAFEVVLRFYPESGHAAQAQEGYNAARLREAKRHFYVGRFYYKNHEYLAAIPRFQSIVTDYQKLGLDEKSFYYLIKSLQHAGQREVALQYLDVFRKFYPDSDYAKKIKI